MKSIYDFIAIHILIYVLIVQNDFCGEELNFRNIYQIWMLLNFVFIIFVLVFKRFHEPLVLILQGYLYICLKKYYPDYVQLSTMLLIIQLANKSNMLLIINQIAAFIISNPYSNRQQIILAIMICVFIAFIYIKWQIQKILDKGKEEINWNEKLLKELPFPLFIINRQSQIIWFNNQGNELMENCSIKKENAFFKELFQDPQLFMQYLNRNQKEQIVQLNTKLIQQYLDQSQLIQQQQNLNQENENKENIGEQLYKSFNKSSNIGCLTLSSLQITEQVEKQILTIMIKQFIQNQTKLYLISVNSSKSFHQNKVLQNHLIQQIKANGLQMFSNLEKDYQKWDNMRNVQTFKESDLKVLSQSIIDLYKIIFEFETYEVSTRFFPQSNQVIFSFKGLLVQLLEIFAGRYLQKFENIALFLDDSIQDKMKGNSGHFSLVLMSILELIATFSENKLHSLKINCNLEYVTDQNKAFLIQIQILWHQIEQLDEIFKEFFFQQIIPLNVNPQVQRYLMVIQKLQNSKSIKIQYKEQAMRVTEDLSEIRIFVKFFIQEDQDNQSNNDSKSPYLSLTFCRQLVNQNPNEIIWTQKNQQKVIDKSYNLIGRASQPIPNFFSKPKLTSKKDEQIIDSILEKKNEIIKELIQVQFSKIAPRLTEKIASLVRKNLEGQLNKFENINLIDEYRQESEVESNGDGKQSSKRSLDAQFEVSSIKQQQF